MPGAAPSGGPPVSETLSGLQIGPGPVSGRRPLHPRGPVLERLAGPSMG